MYKYRLTMTEGQAQVLQKALEIYSRLFIGQIKAAVEQIHFNNNREIDYQRVRKLSDQLKFELTGMQSNASYGIYCNEVDDSARVAWDLQQLLRYQMAWDNNPKGGNTVNFDKPMKSSKKEPLALIEKHSEKKLEE